jgi:hypothetical protein
MSKLININKIPTVQFMEGYTIGSFRFVARSQGGILAISDASDSDNLYYMKYPASTLSVFKKGSLQTIEFKPEGASYWLTVFARRGNKIILIDETILADVSVQLINTLYYETNLYSQSQYTAVAAKTYSDFAYISNVIPETLNI